MRISPVQKKKRITTLFFVKKKIYDYYLMTYLQSAGHFPYTSAAGIAFDVTTQRKNIMHTQKKREVNKWMNV